MHVLECISKILYFETNARNTNMNYYKAYMNAKSCSYKMNEKQKMKKKVRQTKNYEAKRVKKKNRRINK